MTLLLINMNKILYIMDIKYFVCFFFEDFFSLPSLCLFLSTLGIHWRPCLALLVGNTSYFFKYECGACMSVSVFCVSTCMHTSTHACGGQRMTWLSSSGIHIALRNTTSLLWRQDLSFVWNSWFTLASSGIFFLYLAGATIISAHHHLGFYMVVGDWTQVVKLARHTLYPLTISLIPRYVSVADLVNHFLSLYQTVRC